MDPITALGAAGSVVGIASFGLQLGQVLYQFVSQVRGAKKELSGVLDGIHSTASALNRIHELLKDECEYLQQGNQRTILFSPEALNDVKGAADKCLVIFWRIEGTICNNCDSKFESELVRKLTAFNQEINSNNRSPIETNVTVDSLTSVWARFRWPRIAPRLKYYHDELQGHKLSLVLMFNIISLGAHRRNPSEDPEFVYQTVSTIRQMVKHADPAILARILLQEHPQIHGTPQQQRIEASPSRVGDIRQGNFPSRGSLQFDIPQGRRHQSPSYAERDFSSQPREGIIINSRPDKSSHKPRQKISKGNEIRPPSATRRKAMGRSLVLEEGDIVISPEVPLQRDTNGMKPQTEVPKVNLHPVKVGTSVSNSYYEGAVVYKHDPANSRDVRDDVMTLDAEYSSESTRVNEPMVALDTAGVPHGDEKMSPQAIRHARNKTGVGLRHHENDARQAIAFVELFMDPSSVLKINVVQEQIPGGLRNKDDHPEPRYQAQSSEQVRSPDQVQPSAQTSNQSQPFNQAQPMIQDQSSEQIQLLDHVQLSDQAQSPVIDHLPSHKTSVIEDPIPEGQNPVTSPESPDLGHSNAPGHSIEVHPVWQQPRPIDEGQRLMGRSRRQHSQTPTVGNSNTPSQPNHIRPTATQPLSVQEYEVQELAVSPVESIAPDSAVCTGMPFSSSDEQPPSDMWALVPYVVRNLVDFPNAPGTSSQRVEPALIVNPPTPRSPETIQPDAVVRSPRAKSPQGAQQEPTTSAETEPSEIEQRNNRRRARRETRRHAYNDHSDGRTVRSESHSDVSAPPSSITHSSEASRHKHIPSGIITRLHSMFKGKRFVINPPFSAYVVNRGSQFEIVNGDRDISANILSRLKKSFESNDRDIEPEIAAFIIKEGEAFQIPSSGRLKLPRSQLKSLDAQSSRQTWFKTFGFLEKADMDALQDILTASGESEREPTGSRIVHLEMIKENSLKFWAKKSEKVLLAIICAYPEDYASSFDEEDDSRNSPSRVGDDLAGRQRRPYSSSQRTTMPHRASNPPPMMSRATTYAQPLPPRLPPGARPNGPPSPPRVPRSFYAPPPPPAAVNNNIRPPPLPPGVRIAVPPQQPQPPQQGPYFPQQPPLHVNMARVQDLTLLKPMTEADCIKKLTTHGVWTIQRVVSLEEMEDKSSKSWQQCTVMKELLRNTEILERIRALDNDDLSIIQKKLDLHPDQQEQISDLLAAVAREERDRSYEWQLRQLEIIHRKSSWRSKQIIAIVVYLSRAPTPGANVISMYHAERQQAEMVAQPMKAPPDPSPQPYPFSPRVQKQQQQPPLLPPPQPPAGIAVDSSKRNNTKTSGSKSKSRRKWYHDDTDSHYSYDSDDDSSNFSSDATDQKRDRRKSTRHIRSSIHVSRRSPSPSRRKKDYIDPSTRYASDMPHVYKEGIDPVAAAYNAGRVAADEERLRNEIYRRPAPGPPQAGHEATYVTPHPAPQYMPDRYAPDIPRPVFSYGNPSRPAEEEMRYEQIMQRADGRLDGRRFTDDYERQERELEEQRQMSSKKIRQRIGPITVPNDQIYMDDRYQVDRLGHENKLEPIRDELEYPTYHDNRRYHPQDGWDEDKTIDPNIWTKLLDKWTPPKANDDGQNASASRPQNLDISSDKGDQRSEEAGEPSAATVSAHNTGFVWYGRSDGAEEPTMVGGTKDPDVVSGRGDRRPVEDGEPSTDAPGVQYRDVFSEKGDKSAQENDGVQEEVRGRTLSSTYPLSNPSRQSTVEDADPTDEEQRKARQSANNMIFSENQSGPSSQPALNSAEKGKGKAPIRQSPDPQHRHQRSQPSWANPAWAQSIVETTANDDSPDDRPRVERRPSYRRHFSEDTGMRRERPNERFDNGRSADDYVARRPFLTSERILSESPERFANPAAIPNRIYPERTYSESPQRPEYQTPPPPPPRPRGIYSNESVLPRERAIRRVIFSDPGPVNPTVPSRTYVEPGQRGIDSAMPSRTYIEPGQRGMDPTMTGRTYMEPGQRGIDPTMTSRTYIEPGRRGMDPTMASRTYQEMPERTYMGPPPRFSNPIGPRVIHSDSVPPHIPAEYPSTSYPERRYSRIYSEPQYAHPIDPYSDSNPWADDPGLRRTGSYERMPW